MARNKVPVAARLTRKLVSVARRNGVVTADDAQRYLDRINYTGSRALIGAVLRNSFTSVGNTRSKVPSNRSRTIRVWKAPRSLV